MQTAGWRSSEHPSVILLSSPRRSMLEAQAQVSRAPLACTHRPRFYNKVGLVSLDLNLLLCKTPASDLLASFFPSDSLGQAEKNNVRPFQRKSANSSLSGCGPHLLTAFPSEAREILTRISQLALKPRSIWMASWGGQLVNLPASCYFCIGFLKLGETRVVCQLLHKRQNSTKHHPASLSIHLLMPVLFEAASTQTALHIHIQGAYSERGPQWAEGHTGNHTPRHSFYQSSVLANKSKK